MWFRQEFRPTRRGPVGREFMHDNHDPYLKIYAPLASRFGVEIEKMRIGIFRGRSAPLRVPPPKKGAHMLDNLRRRAQTSMTNQMLTGRLKLSYVQVIRGGGEGLVK